MKKIELLFIYLVIISSVFNFQLPTFNFQLSMKQPVLRVIAQSPVLLSKHLIDVKCQCDELDASAAKTCQPLHRKHTKAILALLQEIGDERKMVIRMIQVQQEQINKYRKSIRDGRKTVKRGAPASLDSVTMETMIQMILRVIQDIKDGIPTLIEPLVVRIHKRLSKLQKHMQLFEQSIELSL